MTVRKRITEILLWLSVVVWGCMLGGIFYETLVVIPVWTADLPASLAVMTHPQYPLTPANMWAPVGNLNALFSVAVLIAAWNQPLRRRWLAIAVGLIILSFIMQFGFFWRQIGLMLEPNARLEEIESAARAYATVNWFRVAYVAAGFVATLIAFRLEPQSRMEINPSSVVFEKV